MIATAWLGRFRHDEVSSPVQLDTPSQGDFKFLPRVELFTSTDQQILQNNINNWLISRVLIPDVFFQIQDIKFDTAQLSNNEIQYSGRIFFFLIDQV